MIGPIHRGPDRMLIHRTPDTIRAPFAKYSHAVEVPPGTRLLFCSGQLGIAPDDELCRRLAAPAAPAPAAEAPAADAPAYVLHAGTAADGDRLVSAGGRVLSVVALGSLLNAEIALCFALAKVLAQLGFCRLD